VSYCIDLDGRRALVTGAGQGVGRAIALALAQAGAEVVVNDVRPAPAGDVVEEIRAAGGTAAPAVFDVTDFAAVQAGVAAAGPLHILVNNAGNAGTQGWTFTPFAETAPADWQRYLDINLLGVMNCTRAVLPAMSELGDGRIVTIISDSARSGEPYMAAYAAAKAGAAGFARSIAREVGRFGITVNNVSLGTISTGVDDESSVEDRKRLRQYIIRRTGRPDDVAPLVTLLASPLASWITGQTIPVNGGYTVNL
jgi:NAD(P)-dependent dehydrogenase (short-subunit alcohol dehydrogenase family)